MSMSVIVMQTPTIAEVLQRQNEAIRAFAEVKVSPPQLVAQRLTSTHHGRTRLPPMILADTGVLSLLISAPVEKDIKKLVVYKLHKLVSRQTSDFKMQSSKNSSNQGKK